MYIFKDTKSSSEIRVIQISDNYYICFDDINRVFKRFGFIEKLDGVILFGDDLKDLKFKFEGKYEFNNLGVPVILNIDKCIYFHKDIAFDNNKLLSLELKKYITCEFEKFILNESMNFDNEKVKLLRF